MFGIRTFVIMKVILPLMVGLVLTSLLTLFGILFIYPLALEESSFPFFLLPSDLFLEKQITSMVISDFATISSSTSLYFQDFFTKV